MKETPISECEQNFIIQAIKNNQRIDGRQNNEFRNVRINFGFDTGSVLVALGETKVIAQVSCELGAPKAARPNEGTMYINVDLGKMAASHLESGRFSELSLQVNRALERTFIDSNCVDLESLCVIAEECAWALRVDLYVLNHEGNLIDCSSIAVLSALAHFKRPDVTVIESEVVIQSITEKDPLPIVLHHYPVCVSYCTVDNGYIAITDPTAMEERISDSLMVFGLNSFQELCCLNLGGTSLTSTALLLQCAKRAASRSKFLVDLIKNSLKLDQDARNRKQVIGFTECLRLNKISGLAEDRLRVKLRHFNFKCVQANKQGHEKMEQSSSTPHNVMAIGEKSIILNSNQSNIKWVPDDDEDEAYNLCNSDDGSSIEENDEKLC